MVQAASPLHEEANQPTMTPSMWKCPLSSCCHLFHGCTAAVKKLLTSATWGADDSRISYWPTTKIPHFILEFDTLAFFPTHFQSFTSPRIVPTCDSPICIGNQFPLHQKPTRRKLAGCRGTSCSLQTNGHHQSLTEPDHHPGAAPKAPQHSHSASQHKGEEFSPHSPGSSAPLPRTTGREQHTSCSLVVNPPLVSANKRPWCFMPRPKAVTILSE